MSGFPLAAFNAMRLIAPGAAPKAAENRLGVRS